MDRHEMAKKLYQARKMQTPEEVKTFEKARVFLFSTRDSFILSALFAAFDDSTEQHEVMWGLIHDAEAFNREIYVREMAMAIPRMLPHSKNWALLILQRVLSNKEAFLIYRNVVPNLSLETKEANKKLLGKIGKSKPKLGKQVRELLKLL